MNGTASASPRLRVAAYCRAAADGEERNTFLDAQRERYAEQINGNPDWTMAGIFADIGDSRSAHPQFQKMLRKCRQKKIDLILVRSVSRFARCMAECLSIVRELRELGIEVIFEKEDIHTLDPNSDMLLSLTAVFARAECENLTRNSVHRHYMTLGSRPAKGTWKKTIRLPGRPDKTILFKME